MRALDAQFVQQPEEGVDPVSGEVGGGGSGWLESPNPTMSDAMSYRSPSTRSQLDSAVAPGPDPCSHSTASFDGVPDVWTRKR
ncbi:hypothetical protein BJF79_13000 [Actinomadura sp. CNU-125]|nr:hypothetical protein BJF79_13000 [Actinomadura sp. CNU-125]